jgi:CRISPR-associated endonuclease Cas2
MNRHYIISYDISVTALRTKIALLLKRHGCERLQKSVFLAPNIKTEDLMELKSELKRLVSTHSGYISSDSIVCFPIKRTDVTDMAWAGDTKELRRILDELLFIMI